MVGSLLHPLNIFILGLGGGFLIPLLNRLGKTWVVAGFIVALLAMTLISALLMVVVSRFTAASRPAAATLARYF